MMVRSSGAGSGGICSSRPVPQSRWAWACRPCRAALRHRPDAPEHLDGTGVTGAHPDGPGPLSLTEETPDPPPGRRGRRLPPGRSGHHDVPGRGRRAR